ncbi:hypothetical protein [Nocardioides sp. P5_C9_2]
MAVLTEPPGLPLLSDHARFAWRHRAVIGALMALGLLAGLAWSLVQPTSYSSTASVALAPVPKYVLPTGIGVVPPAVSIDTDAQLLYSPAVLGAVARVLGTDEDVAFQHMSVTASPTSRVLHLAVTASSRTTAAEAANAAVSALVQVRRDSLGALRADQLRLLRLWTAGQEDLLAQAQGTQAVIPADDDVVAQVIALREGLQELEEARLSPAEVVDPATPATLPDASNAQVPLTSGAMLGLLAGCLIGVRRDRRRLAVASTQNLRPRTHPVGPVPAALTTQG